MDRRTASRTQSPPPTSMGRWLLLSLGVALTIAGLVLASGCNGGKTNIKEDKLFPQDKVTSAFHAKHAQQGQKCSNCHKVDDSGLVTRPGTDDHAPCDICHGEAFYTAPGDTFKIMEANYDRDTFCGVCHNEINALIKGGTTVYDYPRPGRVRAIQLAFNFNHKQHIGLGAKCEDCHTVERSADAPYASLPSHRECLKCHADGKPAASKKIDASNEKSCTVCHGKNQEIELARFITNDIKFTHGKHFVANDGDIKCETCHYEIERSVSARDRVLPQMEDCAKCHHDRKKTPKRVGMNNCGACHRSEDIDKKPLPKNHEKFTASLTPEGGQDGWLTLDDVAAGGVGVVADIRGLAPVTRTNPNSSTKPENHTILFRTNHAQAASMSDAKCGSCHTSVSGTPRDSCTDCHSSWRPRNHTLRWRGVEHGRVAAMNPQNCSTCHMAEFCTECHNIPPPSHSPLQVFKFQHSASARRNARACLTCHTFETTCTECHILDIIPAGVGQ